MPAVIPKRIARLSDLCSTGAGRYALKGIHLKLTEKKYCGLTEIMWECAATDGRRLGIFRGVNLEMPEAAQRTLDRLAPTGPEVPSIIPAKTWMMAFKLGGKDEPVVIFAGEKELLLVVGNDVIRELPLEGRFPDYMQVLPRSSPSLDCVLDAKYLGSMAAVAQAAARGGKGQDDARLRLFGYGKASPVGFAYDGGDVLFDGMLMPLS